MNRFLTLLTAIALLCAKPVFSQTYTESFEGGAVPGCVNLLNSYTTTISGEVINGTGSLYANPPVNDIGTRDYLSPYLNIIATNLNISYWFQLNDELKGTKERIIEVGLQNVNGVYTPLNTFTINKDVPDQTIAQLRSVNVTAPSIGIYRLVLKMGGGNGLGSVRITVDDISIDNATPYYATFCNSAPIAVNDLFIAPLMGAFSNNVIINTVGGSDNEPNGETLTPSLVSVPTASEGTLTLRADGSFTFTPSPSFTGGTVTFTYRLTDNGFAPLSSNIATVTITYPVVITLPVKLLNFSGKVVNNKVSLTWAMAGNENGNYFEVLRSTDGKSYSMAGVVFFNSKAGAENYNLTDAVELAPITYYKLKIVHKDHSVSYSNALLLKSATTTAGSSLAILQNPVEANLNFTYTSSATTLSNVVIYNTAGVRVFSTKINTQKGANTVSFPLDNKLAPGTYLLEITNATERSVSKLIKR